MSIAILPAWGGDNCIPWKGVSLFSGKPMIAPSFEVAMQSRKLWRCKICDYIEISANAYIKDTDIHFNSLIFGSSRNLVIKPRKN